MYYHTDTSTIVGMLIIGLFSIRRGEVKRFPAAVPFVLLRLSRVHSSLRDQRSGSPSMGSEG